MELMKENTPLRIKLNFFSEDGVDDQQPDDNGADDQQSKGGSGKTKVEFSPEQQKEVNRISAKEKAEARTALLKELGIDETDTKKAKEAIAAHKAHIESQKTDLQKALDKIEAESKAKEALEHSTTKLEQKLKALELKANLDTVDDLIILASAKVTPTKDFNAVIEEFKITYPTFFEADDSGKKGGTGGTVQSRKFEGKMTGIGKRLATNATTNAPKKSSYFSN